MLFSTFCSYFLCLMRETFLKYCEKACTLHEKTLPDRPALPILRCILPGKSARLVRAVVRLKKTVVFVAFGTL